MQVLLVDAYQQSKTGRLNFASYERTVRASLGEASRGEKPDIFVRKLTDLKDYICDWKTDILNENSKRSCLKFDKLDMICIGGDMKIVPWDPVFTHAIILLQMAALCEKAVIGCGSGAFAGIYHAATQGARFNMLNGPNGDALEKLSMYPRYSIGTATYPSGWMDNANGDVYSFDKKSSAWRPICNIGIHRVASSGKPVSPSKLDVDMKLSRGDHSLTGDQIPEAIDETDTVASIRTIFVQHRIVRDIPARSFVVTSIPNWHINKNGAIPNGVAILADDSKGRPLVFTIVNGLFFAFEIDENRGYLSVKHMLMSFFSATIHDLKESAEPKKLIFDYLFGERVRGAWRYDSGVARYDMSQCLAAMPISTHLPEGPVRVDPPVIDLFFPPVKEQMVYLSAVQQRKGTTLGKKPAVVIRNPVQSRAKRLEVFMKSTGNASTLKVAEAALRMTREEDPYGFDEFVPESYRENIQGKVIDTTYVKTRSPEKSSHYAAGQVTKTPNKLGPSLEDVYPPYGIKPPSTPPLTKSPSGIRRTFNRTDQAFDTAEVNKFEETKTLSFNPSDWQLLRKNLDDDEYNRKMGYQREDGSKLMATNREALHLPSYHPGETNRTNLAATRILTGRPRSNYKKLEKTFTAIDKKEKDKNYSGAYTNVYRSEVEQEIHEYNESKKKFVGGVYFYKILFYHLIFYFCYFKQIMLFYSSNRRL